MSEHYDYIAVVPNLPYTHHESVNSRGYPAIHAIAKADTSRTLCGKNPEYWDVQGIPLADVNCKTCKRIMDRGQAL